MPNRSAIHDLATLGPESRTERLLLGKLPPVYAYLLAVASVGIAVAAAFGLHRWLPHANLSLVFVTAVLLTAVKTGLWPAIVTALLSFLAYNFFFTTPYHTFTVEERADVATLAFFVVMAVLAGSLGARLRAHVARTRAAVQRLTNLTGFSRRMAAAADADEVLAALVDHIAQTLHAPGVAVAGERRASRDARPEIADRLGHGAPIPHGWQPFDLATASGRIGRVAVGPLPPGDESLQLARALCDQAAVALERTRLVADLAQARVQGEAEQLRTALLSSVSHDLRTPLAAVIGSVTTLLELGDNVRPADRQELLDTALTEAERLNRYIQNLLDMTRLGHGSLALHRDWTDLHDIVSSALARLRTPLAGLRVETAIDVGLPLLYVHGALVEQALVNVIDNAGRASPPGGRIIIAAHREDRHMAVDVIDEGPGIPAQERERVFDMFYSVRRGDSSAPGTGLGLSISLGLIGAHGGSIAALPGPDGKGTRMRITLPIAEPPADRSEPA